MSEPKHGVQTAANRWLRRARVVLLSFASMYALAVLLVMTPLIQTQCVTPAIDFILRDSQRVCSVLYAHYIDFWSYDKFNHPENYGLAREYENTGFN